MFNGEIALDSTIEFLTKQGFSREEAVKIAYKQCDKRGKGVKRKMLRDRKLAHPKGRKYLIQTMFEKIISTHDCSYKIEQRLKTRFGCKTSQLGKFMWDKQWPSGILTAIVHEILDWVEDEKEKKYKQKLRVSLGDDKDVGQRKMNVKMDLLKKQHKKFLKNFRNDIILAEGDVPLREHTMNILRRYISPGNKTELNTLYNEDKSVKYQHINDAAGAKAPANICFPFQKGRCKQGNACSLLHICALDGEKHPLKDCPDWRGFMNYYAGTQGSVGFGRGGGRGGGPARKRGRFGGGFGRGGFGGYNHNNHNGGGYNNNNRGGYGGGNNTANNNNGNGNGGGIAPEMMEFSKMISTAVATAMQQNKGGNKSGK